MSVERHATISDCWRGKHYRCPGSITVKYEHEDDAEVRVGDTWKCVCSCHLVKEAVERIRLQREAQVQDGAVVDVGGGDVVVGEVELVAPGQVAGADVLDDVEGGEGVADQVGDTPAPVDADVSPLAVKGDDEG